MDASLQTRAEQLAQEIAGQAETVDDLNDLMRLMMKSTIQRMLDTEMDVHLGRRPGVVPAEPSAKELPPAYPLPLQLRMGLRYSGKAGSLKENQPFLPNPYSHNPWTKKWGHLTRAAHLVLPYSTSIWRFWNNLHCSAIGSRSLR